MINSPRLSLGVVDKENTVTYSAGGRGVQSLGSIIEIEAGLVQTWQSEKLPVMS